MILTVAILAILAVVVPAWLCWKYQPPGPLTVPIAVRYLLMCLALFLCSLLALRDPLLVDVARFMLGAAALFTGALVAVVGGELCQS